MENQVSISSHSLPFLDLFAGSMEGIRSKHLEIDVGCRFTEIPRHKASQIELPAGFRWSTPTVRLPPGRTFTVQWLKFFFGRAGTVIEWDDALGSVLPESYLATSQWNPTIIDGNLTVLLDFEDPSFLRGKSTTVLRILWRYVWTPTHGRQVGRNHPIIGYSACDTFSNVFWLFSDCHTNFTRRPVNPIIPFLQNWHCTKWLIVKYGILGIFDSLSDNLRILGYYCISHHLERKMRSGQLLAEKHVSIFHCIA